MATLLSQGSWVNPEDASGPRERQIGFPWVFDRRGLSAPAPLPAAADQGGDDLGAAVAPDGVGIPGAGVGLYKSQAGQSVLINGAAGGVGTYAVQIAKAMGAEVTGVTSARNVELVRSLGADRVVDYTREDFTDGENRYDVIIDNVANRSLPDLRRALAPEGVIVMVTVDKSGKWIGPLPVPNQSAVANAAGSAKGGLVHR